MSERGFNDEERVADAEAFVRSVLDRWGQVESEATIHAVAMQVVASLPRARMYSLDSASEWQDFNAEEKSP